MPTYPQLTDYSDTKEYFVRTACDVFRSIRFRSSEDIHSFFVQYTDASDFFDWFNERVAQKEYFGRNVFFGETTTKDGKVEPRERNGRGPIAKVDEGNFNRFWDLASGYLPQMDGDGEGINLLQFLSLFSIVMNEASRFRPVSEGGNLAYMYKYNAQTPLNKSAAWLFSDETFKTAHSALDFYDEVTAASAEDEVGDEWKTGRYPARTKDNPNGFPVDPDEGGIICQADFFKFRGRGFIQHTHRSVYKTIIEELLEYDGTNEVLTKHLTKWKEQWNSEVEKIATCTTTEDWDELFMETDLLVPCVALRRFKASSGFLRLDMDDVDGLVGEDRGSVQWTAKLVAGMNAPVYPRLFECRVIQLLDRLIADYSSKIG